MTRDEVYQAYTVEDGIIRSPGKFEGEAAWVPYFWEQEPDEHELSKDGTMEYLLFNISAADISEFPELEGRSVLRLWERNDGFVIGF